MRQHNKVLRELEADIDAVTLDGHDVPVKLKVFDSLFVPLAKWSMLLTGNYRCITLHEPQSIRDAVHGDLKLSQSIYDHVDAIARRLGADPADQVPFEKYAKAAESLLKPSSAARAVASGAPFIERVDLLVKLISHQLGMPQCRDRPHGRDRGSETERADRGGRIRLGVTGSSCRDQVGGQCKGGFRSRPRNPLPDRRPLLRCRKAAGRAPPARASGHPTGCAKS